MNGCAIAFNLILWAYFPKKYTSFLYSIPLPSPPTNTLNLNIPPNNFVDSQKWCHKKISYTHKRQGQGQGQTDSMYRTKFIWIVLASAIATVHATRVSGNLWVMWWGDMGVLLHPSYVCVFYIGLLLGGGHTGALRAFSYIQSPCSSGSLQARPKVWLWLTIPRRWWW